MLVCPQCQFENPDQNKFCQRCGTSLTHRQCPQCGTNVALNVLGCPSCGTRTGTIWWAIISRSDVTTSLPAQEYIDQNQRYQLLEPLAASAEFQGRVLDCQPLQPSPLITLATDASLLGSRNIPVIAQAYLALHSQFPQTCPPIHDAWQQDGTQVVLIADRSDWQQLQQRWHEENPAIAQIWQCFSQLAQLWEALEPWRCRQSLLELANLRVGPNQTFGLQRLYAESATQEPLTVIDLGRAWQELLASKEAQAGISQLLAALQHGEIQTVDVLRQQLEGIKLEQQADPNSAPVLSTTTLLTPESTTTNQESVDVEVSSSVNLEQVTQPQSPMHSDDMSTALLPMQLFSLEDVGYTDVGRQRDHNEDYFGIETRISKQEHPGSRKLGVRGIYILCDGMGGHAGGEVASALAVKTLQEYFQTHWQSEDLPDETTLRSSVILANQAIYDLNQQDTRFGTGRMGTTLVMVLLQDTKFAVVHVGDSRLYWLTRREGLQQLTVDHEVGQREISRGVEPGLAYSRPDAYQLTQALGPRDENFIKPDIKFLDFNEDTLLILASDGLCDNDLLEQHWKTHLQPLLSSSKNLEQGAMELIELANNYNGHDNITAILIRAKVRPDMQQTQQG